MTHFRLCTVIFNSASLIFLIVVFKNRKKHCQKTLDTEIYFSTEAKKLLNSFLNQNYEFQNNKSECKKLAFYIFFIIFLLKI